VEKDKEFEEWFRKNFYSGDKPLIYIHISNASKFKNFCKMAWDASKQRILDKIKDVLEGE